MIPSLRGAPRALALRLLPTLVACVAGAQAPERAGFVTLLGRDTVALETFTRAATRLDGELMVRVPGTVLFRYTIERRGDGSLARTAIELRPLGVPALAERRVTMVFQGDSARMSIDSAAQRRTVTIAAPRDAAALFMTGFDASFGLYESIGMYELALAALRWPGDTTVVPALNPLTGRVGARRFVRRGPGTVDASWFRIAWTHLALDSLGRILSVDATETTEKTRSSRTEPLDVARLARAFAERDRRGGGLGAASRDTAVSATLGGATLVVTYGSPRLRGRSVLGTVVPWDTVWRTGANAATVLTTERAIAIGGVSLPAGSYSLWTIPRRDGVELVVNRRHGQWGTDHDPAQDVARIPMRTSEAPEPREVFAITLDGTDQARTLAIAWDRFVWTVPIRVP